jgi:nucleoside-diphosphate-sugar epimerase
MKIFMTGATGYVGHAILDEVLAGGHEVLALARSDTSETALVAMEVRTLCGTLHDDAVLQQGAAQADAVIHTGFDHDFTRFRENCEQDARAIAALGRGIAQTGGLLIATSAIGILPRGGLVDEDSRPATGPAASPRALTETATGVLREAGARVIVVRLPPSVHGVGDPNFVATLVRIAREKGISGYIGAGDNRWPAVHRNDAARVFATCAACPPTLGTVHAVAETGIRFEDIARAIGTGLNLPVVSIDPKDAAVHFGGFAHFAAMDVTASAERSARALDWTPTGPTLLKDIEDGLYFR